MKKLILAAFSTVALFGVAACSDTDGTKTQSVEPPVQAQPVPQTDPSALPAPAAPANDAAPEGGVKPAEPAPAAPAQ